MEHYRTYLAGCLIGAALFVAFTGHVSAAEPGNVDVGNAIVGISDRYVATEVICDNAVALVAARSRDGSGIEHTQYTPIQVPSQDGGQVKVSCNQGQYFLEGQRLSSVVLTNYAMVSAKQGADRTK